MTRKASTLKVSLKQIPTRLVSTIEIMGAPEFTRGFEDARQGIAFDWRIGADQPDSNADWDYERGRLFAHIAPLKMPLRIDGKLNRKAIALCNAAFNRKLIT
jgi:hypothetical protein